MAEPGYDNEPSAAAEAPAIVFVDMVEVDVATGTARTLSRAFLRKQASRKPSLSALDMFKAAGLLALLAVGAPFLMWFFVWSSDFRQVLEAGSFFGFVLTGILVMKTIVDRREGGREAIGLVMPAKAVAWLKSLWYYFLGMGALFASLLVIVTFLFAFGYNFGGAGETVRRYYNDTNIFSFMSTVFVAPVVEEIIFRGIGLSGYRNTGSERRAVAWTSVVFALMHGPTAPFVFFNGVALAYIRLRTGSLFCAMAIHAMHNMMVMCMRV